MAEQRAERRNRLEHDVHMNLIAERRCEYGLAQTQPGGAKFAFHLKAVQIQRNLEIVEKIRSIQNAVMELHVEKLDSEHVGRAAQFVNSKNERREIALAHPPLCDAMRVFEEFGIGAIDHAKDVQIRMPGAKFAGNRGAV